MLWIDSTINVLPFIIYTRNESQDSLLNESLTRKILMIPERIITVLKRFIN